MLRGHVFIVNENTLPIHLEYMFVGTSAGQKDNNISLLEDMLRVKENDFIFFYIEGKESQKGRFFGIFKALNNKVYHLVENSAKHPNLNIKLIYRKEINPYKAYSKGVLEWIALDKLPTYSKELLWSLIYRKMKGHRGNTMLFPWEIEKLISLIEYENEGHYFSDQHFTFDKNTYQITPGNQTYFHKIGEPIQLSLNDLKKSETHLQAYILQNLSISNNTFLPEVFGKNIVWIGNEVFAGSSMQKIDIFIIEKIDEVEYIYRIIELKHPKSGTGINSAPIQLEYYINWAREDIGGHIIGSKKFNIKPILFSLTNQFNSVPKSIITQIKSLENISNSPEIWEINYDNQINKVL